MCSPALHLRECHLHSGGPRPPVSAGPVPRCPAPPSLEAGAVHLLPGGTSEENVSSTRLEGISGRQAQPLLPLLPEAPPAGPQLPSTMGRVLPGSCSDQSTSLLQADTLSLSWGAWTLVTSCTSSQEPRPPPGLLCGSNGRRCPLLSGVAALSTPMLLVERGLCVSPALGPPGQADKGTPGPLLEKQVLGDSGSYLHAVPVQTDGRERGEDVKFFSNGFIWIEFTHHKMNLSVYRSVGFSVFTELPGQRRHQIPECSHLSSKTPPTL